MIVVSPRAAARDHTRSVAGLCASLRKTAAADWTSALVVSAGAGEAKPRTLILIAFPLRPTVDGLSQTHG